MRMTLIDKGPVAPAPPMSPLLEQATAEIASWQAVTCALHRDLYDPERADGADFHFGSINLADNELGHIHLDGTVHLATTATLRHALIAAGLAQPMRWYEDWSSMQITDPVSCKTAIWLFRLNYDRLNEVPEIELVERVELYALEGVAK